MSAHHREIIGGPRDGERVIRFEDFIAGIVLDEDMTLAVYLADDIDPDDRHHVIEGIRDALTDLLAEEGHA